MSSWPAGSWVGLIEVTVVDDWLPGHFQDTVLQRLTNEDEDHGLAAAGADDGLERP
jgi:hypothetical protein